MSSAICFNLDQSKILSSGNGLNIFILYRRSGKQVLIVSSGFATVGYGCLIIYFTNILHSLLSHVKKQSSVIFNILQTLRPCVLLLYTVIRTDHTIPAKFSHSILKGYS